MSKLNIDDVYRLFPKFNTYIKNTSIRCKEENLKNYFIDFLETEGKKKCWYNFNQISKLRSLGIVEQVSRNKSKPTQAYFKLVNDKICNIRNQDEFHYKLMNSIHNRLKKSKHNEIVDYLFNKINKEKIYVNQDFIQIEETERTNDSNHFRTDMSINIKTNKIIIEYLEKQHDKEKNLDYPFEKHRALNLLFNNSNTDYKIVHIAYFWEHQYWDSKYYKNFVETICKKIIDYWDISNEYDYYVRKISDIIGNKTLAEQIYKAHTNRDEPIVHLRTLESIIGWKKDSINNIPVSKLWYDTFVDIINQQICSANIQNQNINGFNDFDSDSDSDSDSTSDSDNLNKQDITHELYYKIIDEEIYLTQAGMHHYLRVDRNLFHDINEYNKSVKFNEYIAQGLVDILHELKNKESDLREDYINGL